MLRRRRSIEKSEGVEAAAAAGRRDTAVERRLNESPRFLTPRDDVEKDLQCKRTQQEVSQQLTTALAPSCLASIVRHAL